MNISFRETSINLYYIDNKAYLTQDKLELIFKDDPKLKIAKLPTELLGAPDDEGSNMQEEPSLDTEELLMGLVDEIDDELENELENELEDELEDNLKKELKVVLEPEDVQENEHGNTLEEQLLQDI